MEEVINCSCGKMQTYLSGFRAVQCLMIDCHGEVSKKMVKMFQAVSKVRDGVGSKSLSDFIWHHDG